MSPENPTYNYASCPWLNTKQAAEYLSLSPKTLAIWRHEGKGPAYKIAGQRLVRYHIDDLNAWVKGDSGR